MEVWWVNKGQKIVEQWWVNTIQGDKMIICSARFWPKMGLCHTKLI